MNCLFIYNPNSGKGKILKYLDYIEIELSKVYDTVDLYSTKSGEDARRAAREACGKYDVLVFSGGDGTFNDIINGISSEESRPILGYIPSGTVNDIARNLKLSRNVKRALKVVTDGYVMNHDVGQVNDQYFMYVAAAGTFTEVSYRTDQKIKKRIGKLAYMMDGMKDVFNPVFTEVKVIADGTQYSEVASLVLILNSQSVGGFRLNRHGHLNDGQFDIILVKKGYFKGLYNIFRLFTGGISKKRTQKYLIHVKGSNIKVEVDDSICWTLDGEEGPVGPIDILNLHNHLQIFVPKKKLDKNAITR